MLHRFHAPRMLATCLALTAGLAAQRQPMTSSHTSSHSYLQARSSQPSQAQTYNCTTGVKKCGKALKNAVAKVKALNWDSRVTHALAQANRVHKPVLLLQTLGELDGYA
jgi:hypothetical protein